MKTSVVIYSKDAFVKQHKRCLFCGLNVISSENQIIIYVIWEHCGKGSGAFWSETHRLVGGKTKFCLQDIKNICDYNGVETRSLSGDSILISTVNTDLEIQIDAIVTEKDGLMFIKWVYSPFARINDVKVYSNTTNSTNHQITVLDMIQIQNIFSLGKV